MFAGHSPKPLQAVVEEEWLPFCANSAACRHQYLLLQQAGVSCSATCGYLYTCCCNRCVLQQCNMQIPVPAAATGVSCNSATCGYQYLLLQQLCPATVQHVELLQQVCPCNQIHGRTGIHMLQHLQNTLVAEDTLAAAIPGGGQTPCVFQRLRLCSQSLCCCLHSVRSFVS